MLGSSLRPTSAELDRWLERIGREHPRNVLGGLSRVEEVGARMGVLKPALKNVVVAGTNGKGSTSLFLERLLGADGARVGTTLSPHMHRFNERIRVDGHEVDDGTVIAALENVEEARGGVPLTYFEYAILAALQVFRSSNLEYSVLEVGLGGRLDAVNIVDGDVAVITSIGLDHEEYLGHDREAIGAEKAGILRPGRPFVYGESNMPTSICQRAAALEVPVYAYGRDFDQEVVEGAWRVRTTSRDGRSESRTYSRFPAVARANAATAMQAARLLKTEIPDDVVLEAFAVALPGRFEQIEALGRTWVLDVAHNPHGARFLARQVQERFAGRTVKCLVGCLRDKKIGQILDAFSNIAAETVVTSTAGVRGESARDQVARAHCERTPLPIDSLQDAVDYLRGSTHSSDAILVFGSFDLIERTRGCLLAS